MSRIVHAADQLWSNYHATRTTTVADFAQFEGDVPPHPDGPTRFAETGATLAAHLADLAGPAPVGVIGAAWSLSDLVGQPQRMLDTTGLRGVSWVEAPHLHHQSRLQPRQAVFVGGGATWQELVAFVEAPGPSQRSIATCGSYLQQSVVGAVGTSTAGSRLGEGGVQDRVLGMHLVTGAGSAWVERQSDPTLGHVALDFADEVIRSDAVFDSALVHLGGMGLVNGLVIETVPPDLFTVTRATRAVDAQWLALVRDGEFAKIARWLGTDAEPVYYEVQIDPFDLFGTPALHTFYLRNSTQAGLVDAPPAPAAAALRVNDALASLGDGLQTAGFLGDSLPFRAGRCPGCDCSDRTQALVDMFRYYSCCVFQDLPTSAPATWGTIHQQGPEAKRQGVVFSAAFAVPRDSVEQALPAICAAALGQPRQFLYTLRFVSNARGALAFQRWPESLVIDFEGLKVSPDIQRDAERSLALAQDALGAGGVPFSAHWGKLGGPDEAKVEADFGPAADPDSPIGRWQAARARLLSTTRGQELAGNAALARWGLAQP